jgi:peptidoglycan/LPS O-acetylase OafA/YrhL
MRLPLLVLAGEISYGVYLLQVPVRRYVLPWTGFTTTSTGGVMVLFALLILAAYCSHVLIERPVMTAARRFRVGRSPALRATQPS